MANACLMVFDGNGKSDSGSAEGISFNGSDSLFSLIEASRSAYADTISLGCKILFSEFKIQSFLLGL